MMGKFNLSNAVKIGKTFVTKHSPEILTGIGVAGMVATTVLAVKATPKAVRLMEEEKEATKVEKLTPIETVKVAWKPYIPAAVTGVVSIACIVGASSVSARRTTALAAAYKISETALTEYKEKVVETIGEKKEKTIQEALHKEQITKNTPNTSEIIITGDGDTLCYDCWGGRYFKSNRDKLVKAENEINRRLRNENDISLNEFYYEIGLDGVESGDYLGWSIDNGYIDLDFSSQLTPEGTPCLVFSFGNRPRYEYV